ncbi:histone acetyltransferase KAT6A isoform X1 [Drosophila teissieri]|uniref:histone acetyltransferase KAT6A isoform X1 n=1 Tax=Drosophila teissieri TaxID=7243 RepID=UPI001CBA4C59|nr:histone acetyltransferase KAT6A isoform X1 [Drosophila teissieri]XP_043662236.1 histone acetyltransferase KAT6A isoform X1 [Drosophila teissieri]XP_043662237.1 histone acetyltransferase KAT6A isoform X1 [Drosophila teissieri]
MANRFVGPSGAMVVLLAVVQCILATPQRTAAFSLQAAVDELHRREAAKYPLNAPPQPALDDWEEDGDLFGKNRNRNRHRVNKALGKYLERDEDNYGPDHNLGLGLGLGMGLGLDDGGDLGPSNPSDEKRKRFSSFRERDEQFDGPAPSAFREREIQPLNAEPAHNELTEQFLREIEEARDRDAVRQWWRHLDQAKTQQDPEQEAEQFEQKKRMRVPPYYLLMQKKRSYPVLPWLPYNGDKRKRFPVAKRSTSNSNPESPLARTDERVAQELSELFGKPGEPQSHPEEKRKRSADEQPKVTTKLPESPPATATALGDMRLEINFQRVNITPKETPTSAPAGAGEMVQHGGHAGHHGGHVPGMSPEYHHRKRSDHAHGENAEDPEADEHDEEGEESSDEDDHDEFDEEDGEADLEAEEAEERRRKKKRAAASLSGNGGSPKHLHAPTVGHLMLRAKKSIDWSQYFGLDRKKKSLQKTETLKKRSETDSSTNNDEENDDDSSEAEKKKRDFDAEKLDSMDKKLQSIEDFIIDETIKYTGAHEGLNSKDDIRRIKDHVLSRLATAYSLEKMRRALDKLRRSVDNESHLMRNTIEPESEENALDSNYWLTKQSVKKEQADQLAEDSKPPKDMEKKKRSGYLRYPEQPNTMEEALSLGSAPYETLNDAYLGNKNYIVGSNQCPIIESMAERCRGVDLISGDINQELLPLCGVHQICYLCGASQVACDYQYLAEADGVCGDSNECQSAARSILMILRGSHGRQLGPRECLKNPCLYRAMREIGL